MMIPDIEAYTEFLDTPIEQSECNGLTFFAEDAQKPFLTANEHMWSVFEPELKTQTIDLGLAAQFRDRVRACLMEILASGQYSIVDAA